MGSYEVMHKWERKIEEESSESEYGQEDSFKSNKMMQITTIKEDPDE